MVGRLTSHGRKYISEQTLLAEVLALADDRRESTRDLQIFRLAYRPGNTLWRAGCPAFTVSSNGRTGIQQVVEVFILAAESALAGIAAQVPVGSAPELSG
jgi:hypothetical protein